MGWGSKQTSVFGESSIEVFKNLGVGCGGVMNAAFAITLKAAFAPSLPPPSPCLLEMGRAHREILHCSRDERVVLVSGMLTAGVAAAAVGGKIPHAHSQE